MTVGLPSFKGLVQAVYTGLGENWESYSVTEREVMRSGGKLEGQYERSPPLP